MEILEPEVAFQRGKVAPLDGGAWGCDEVPGLQQARIRDLFLACDDTQAHQLPDQAPQRQAALGR